MGRCRKGKGIKIIAKHFGKGIYDCKILESCCEAINEAIRIGVIKVEHEFDSIKESMEVGCFVRTSSYGVGYDCAFLTYCPFCGEKIEIIKEELNERSKE